MGFLKNQILPPINCIASRLVDYPFEALPNQSAVQPRIQAIPTKVVQTWEENSFGKRHLQSLKQFRKLNTDMSFQLFDAEARDDYMRQVWGDHPIQEVYKRAKFGTLKADVFRYCIIYDQGGYYFDISKGLDTSISSLHSPEMSGFISYEGNLTGVTASPVAQSSLLRPQNLVIQWAFGFKVKHELLLNLINDIVLRFPNYIGKSFASPKNAIVELSGPKAMTRALHKFIETNSAHELAQHDVDFDGHGIYSLRGAGARHHKYPSYAFIENSSLFS